MEKVLNEPRFSSYSIFLRSETRQLFGCPEIENEEQWTTFALTEARQKGRKRMSDVMPLTSAHSPAGAPLREPFDLD